ncbi:MAG: DUF3887 domain-containing protein [Eubacteriales bacterium]|nr:DUF3887 domain-containing protein [Eubacteriales bacterium]
MRNWKSMKNWKRKIVAAVLTLSVVLGAFGCTAGKPLPDGFDGDAVAKKAGEMATLATNGDYDALIAAMRDDLKDALTADQLRDSWAPVYEKAGAFESVMKTVLSGVADPNSNEEYAVAQVLVKHENASLLYTFSFDKDLMLVGLYLK